VKKRKEAAIKSTDKYLHV